MFCAGLQRGWGEVGGAARLAGDRRGIERRGAAGRGWRDDREGFWGEKEVPRPESGARPLTKVKNLKAVRKIKFEEGIRHSSKAQQNPPSSVISPSGKEPTKNSPSG